MIDMQDLVRPDEINGRAYTDPDVFQLELHKIFTDGWVFVGHDGTLEGMPQPGGLAVAKEDCSTGPARWRTIEGSCSPTGHDPRPRPGTLRTRILARI